MKTRLLKRLRREASDHMATLLRAGFRPSDSYEFGLIYEGYILRCVAELKQKRK
jgi:hypothetical protein|nr:MAG TPA: hypothetical protein [Caudoviricetes sp.]